MKSPQLGLVAFRWIFHCYSPHKQDLVQLHLVFFSNLCLELKELQISSSFTSLFRGYRFVFGDNCIRSAFGLIEALQLDCMYLFRVRFYLGRSCWHVLLLLCSGSKVFILVLICCYLSFCILFLYCFMSECSESLCIIILIFLGVFFLMAGPGTLLCKHKESGEGN